MIFDYFLNTNSKLTFLVVFTGIFHLGFYNARNNFINSDSPPSPPHRDGMLMMTKKIA